MTNVAASMQVFEFFRGWDEHPVTVFAKDLRDAESVYFEWVDRHHEGRPNEAEKIFPYFGRWLLGRPELGAACRLGERGVGYWDREGSRWMVASPCDTPIGDLARPPLPVKYYCASATNGDELMVFAESMSEAADYYLLWHLDAYGEAPEGMHVHKRSRWQLVLALAPLRDEMDAGNVGIARWSADEGWHIAGSKGRHSPGGHMS